MASPRALTSLRLVALLAAGLAAGGIGCGDKAAEAPAPRPGAGGSAGTAAAPASSGSVKLYVGDALVDTVPATTVARWARLDTLVPAPSRRLGAWTAIATRGVRDAVLPRPFESYRDYVPVLFPGPGGAPAFGLFDPVALGKRGTPAIVHEGITELRITVDTSGGRGGNDHAGGDDEAVDPAALTLVIKVGGKESTLTGAQLLALPRAPQPGEEEGEPRGWPLATILGAAGVRGATKLVLHDSAGVSLPLEGADLGADAVPFVKLNRQGALRFRLYRKQGTGWQQGGDLRGLARIDVIQ